MEKLWAECSQAEKDEVRQIEHERDGLNWQYSHGLISHRKYRYNRTLLRKRVEKVWNKYAEDMQGV